jgi:hypothetical protein
VAVAVGPVAVVFCVGRMVSRSGPPWQHWSGVSVLSLEHASVDFSKNCWDPFWTCFVNFVMCKSWKIAVSFYVALMGLSGLLHLNWFRLPVLCLFHFSINEISTFGQSLKSMREINSASKKIGSSKLNMFRKPDGKWWCSALETSCHLGHFVRSSCSL